MIMKRGRAGSTGRRAMRIRRTRGLARPFVRPDRLTTLPPELLVDVLTCLPMRQITRLRRLNRHTRHVIDDNEANLTRHSLMYNRSRLRFRHQRLTDFRGLDLIDIIHQYTSYYGALYGRGHTRELHIPHVPIVESLESALAVHFPIFRNSRHGPFSELGTFAWKLQSACTAIECDLRRGRYLSTPAHIARLHLDWLVQSNQSIFGSLDNLIKKLERGDLLSGPHYTYIHGQPQYFLTWRTAMHKCLRNYHPRPWDWRGAGVAYEILQLPDLELRFSYCVKSKAMASVFWDATAEEIDFAGSRFRQAAVLEEMFIW